MLGDCWVQVEPRACIPSLMAKQTSRGAEGTGDATANGDSPAIRYHAEGRPGKIEVIPTKPLASQRDLSHAYTPGVAEACLAIAESPEEAFRLTARGNLVAVVTNGSAVLGLGNIGALAGKPVMEGKANLFKRFADIDVFDIELDCKSADELVSTIKAMAPTFGGINLEDIKAPECFEVEERLQEQLDIPIFHDDQHGTAIISSAALMNAFKLTNRVPNQTQVVFSGAGAAAVACARMYAALGVPTKNIRMYDLNGPLRTSRADLGEAQRAFAKQDMPPTLADALATADVFIGLSAGNLVTPEMVRRMRPDPIVFALANPVPEISYPDAKNAREDVIVATGRSDFPNQVNNVLGFPFVFRGALDCRARKVTGKMMLAAAEALAQLAREDVPDRVLRAYGIERLKFGRDYLIPKPFDPRALLRVAPAVARVAAEEGVARKPIADLEAYRRSLVRLVQRARGFLAPLVDSCRALDKPIRVALPSGYEPAILRAARMLVEEQVCIPVLLGSPRRIRETADLHGISVDGMEIESVGDSPRIAQLAERLWRKRERKGMTQAAAEMLLKNHAWFGSMLVDAGLVDGMVGGYGRAYKETLTPALSVLGVAEGSRLVSGAYAMLFKNRKLFFGDCTVNIQPNARELAEIALNTARLAEMFGETPRVALLSYSDFGEHHQDPSVQTVREAVEIIRQTRPELIVDGEMQADTAINSTKREDFPFNLIKQNANVLIFPNLTAGNIAYKLLLELAEAEALGPLVVGLGGPASVIPLGATEADIFNLATYTVLQAAELRRSESEI